jgi:hypothetical protein
MLGYSIGNNHANMLMRAIIISSHPGRLCLLGYLFSARSNKTNNCHISSSRLVILQQLQQYIIFWTKSHAF